MNIPELKNEMLIIKDLIPNIQGLQAYQINAISVLLSACQLLCDTSDKMLPKKIKDYAGCMPEFIRGGGDQWMWEELRKEGYNLAREEDILFFTKKLMGISEVVCPDNRGDTCLDHRNCESIATAIIQSFG